MVPQPVCMGPRRDRGPRLRGAACLAAVLLAIVTVRPAGAVGPLFSAAFLGLDAGNSQLTDIMAADFNGDGHLDLAVSSVSGGVLVYLGNGDGTFRPSQALSAVEFCMGVAAGDFNAEGHMDLAFASQGRGNRARFCLNTSLAPERTGLPWPVIATS